MKRKGVVAFAFGVPSAIHSNVLIAEIASQKAQELDAPIFTQHDIAQKERTQVYYIDEELGNPPPTLRIARAAVEWASSQAIGELWVVAAGPHLWRCLRDLKEAVKEKKKKIEIRCCVENGFYNDADWFCLNSLQGRTQSRRAWDKRERILKIMPFFFYKKIAS